MSDHLLVRSHSTLGVKPRRPQSERYDGPPVGRPKPKPVPSLPKREALPADENMDDDNRTAQLTQQLSLSAEFPLKRTTEIPMASKPVRWMSTSSLPVLSSHTEEDYPLKLSVIPNKSPKCITTDQLAELINNKGNSLLYNQLTILDARFAYEFEGGHIVDAVHVCQPHQVEALKRDLLARNMGDKLCIVIHCEFSSKRGPTLYEALRSYDRELNSYPNLHFPEMYVLNGGYKDFYSKYPDLCTPKDYVPMHHRDFSEKLQAEMKSYQKNGPGSFKTKSLTRSSSDVNRLHTSPLFCRSQSPGGSRDDEVDDGAGFASRSPCRPLRKQPCLFQLPSSPGKLSGEDSNGSSNQIASPSASIPLISSSFSFSTLPPRASSAPFESSQHSFLSSSTTTEIMEGISSFEDEHDDDGDRRLFASSSSTAPGATRFSRRAFSGPHSNTLTRGASFHVTPTMSRRFACSTPDLPGFVEDDECDTCDFNGPLSSR